MTPPDLLSNPLLSKASPIAGGHSPAAREARREELYQEIGQRPGTLKVRPDTLKPRLFLIAYTDTGHEEDEYTDRYDELLRHMRQQ